LSGRGECLWYMSGGMTSTPAYAYVALKQLFTRYAAATLQR